MGRRRRLPCSAVRAWTIAWSASSRPLLSPQHRPCRPCSTPHRASQIAPDGSGRPALFRSVSKPTIAIRGELPRRSTIWGQIDVGSQRITRKLGTLDRATPGGKVIEVATQITHVSSGATRTHKNLAAQHEENRCDLLHFDEMEVGQGDLSTGKLQTGVLMWGCSSSGVLGQSLEVATFRANNRPEPTAICYSAATGRA